ncbi:MAG TPA: hypothetical protein VFI38_13395 [Candidatus Acidoferrum sp.]|nr:hypothetical protein [Candidatus Acidoferrum sp.]
MDFSLQDTGGSGWGSVSEDFGGNGDTGYGGITSALENIGVNFAAGAASVGLNSLGKSAGVSSPYGSISPAYLTRTPGTVPNYGATFGAGGNGVVLVGVLLVGGLLLFAAFGRKG